MPKPVAVIDIGSNSVRLVVYESLSRSPSPIFNEKCLCGLARGIAETGMLNPEGVEKAHGAIARFMLLAKKLGVEDTHLIATAAVRDATDGKSFVTRIKASFGVNITILSGEEEAEYAALGVVSSMYEPQGVVADLGGGSLELQEIHHTHLSKHKISLPIGPLRFTSNDSTNPIRDYRRHIETELQQFPLAETLADKTCYAVGGAFRHLAKIHMQRKNYPLKILHHFTVTREAFQETLEIINRMDKKTLQKTTGMSSKRMQLLPYANELMRAICSHGKPKAISFSAAGVREGLLFGNLPKAAKTLDPLISGATDMIERFARSTDYSRELFAWMTPLFVQTDEATERLRLAACILSEISCFENTEYRAEMAYRRVMDSSLTGVDHAGRAFIARAVFHRYRDQPDTELQADLQKILSASALHTATIAGHAMRLGKAISACSDGILPHTTLNQTKKKLTLTVEEAYAALAGEQTLKRLNTLALALGCQPKLNIGGKA